MFGSTIELSLYNAEALRGKGLIVTEDNDLGISIVRYHKSDNEWKNKIHGTCDRNDPVVQNHRSVVYSLLTGLPISVAPIRRLSHDVVTRDMLEDNEFVVTEYLDGTMINVFWNPNINKETGNPFGWTLSSRSKIHATCKFTSDRLFNELFEEARVKSGVDYDDLNQRHCYSFVLLHPEIRRVIKYDSPRIVLVSVATCVPKYDSMNTEHVSVSHVMSWDNMIREATRISPNILPTNVSMGSSEVLSHSMSENVRNTLSGWMITKKSGSWGRVRILTDGFDTCASLRGDTASRRTNYIRLMSLDPKGDAIRQYAELYPEEANDIRDLSNTIQSSVNELVSNYKARHVQKTKEHGDLPHWTRRPIWDLHGRYLRSKIPVREPNVFSYFRDISPSAVNRMLKNREKEIRRSQNQSAAPAADAAAAPVPASPPSSSSSSSTSATGTNLSR
jgi:hypothetical protein